MYLLIRARWTVSYIACKVPPTTSYYSSSPVVRMKVPPLIIVMQILGELRIVSPLRSHTAVGQLCHIAVFAALLRSGPLPAAAC